MHATDADSRDPEAANALFRRDVEAYGLRYRCDACAHHAPTEDRCSMDFPNAMLRGPIRAITPEGRLTFCKHFELGEGL